MGLFTDLIMADFLNKKYKLTSSEYFDEYMTELKIGFMTRKLGNSSTPVVEVTLNGDEYTLTTSSLLKTTTIKFKLGEEFEEERADGVKVKSTITLDGNKMTHVMKGEPETCIVREFNGNEIGSDCQQCCLHPRLQSRVIRNLNLSATISPFRSTQIYQRENVTQLLDRRDTFLTSVISSNYLVSMALSVSG